MSLEDGRPITVLHVDDEPRFAELAAEFLERETDRMRVITETSASDGLERLAETEEIDCIVSDYEMPERNGIEFLETVRETYPDIPFILYTGKGSEAVASDAIAADATDYLQKESGTSQYAVLANRIENAVTQYQTKQAVEETEQRYRRLIEESTDVITVVDENGTYEYVSPAAERLLGFPAEELVGENGFEYIHPDDRGHAMEQFGEIVTAPGEKITTEFRFEQPSGGWTWLEVRGRNLLDDPVVDGIVVYARDVTDRKEREAALRRERDRFSALFDQLAEPVVEVSFDGDTAIVQRINGAFEDTFGAGESSLVGESLDAHIVPEEDRESAHELNRLLKDGECHERKLRRQTPAGVRYFRSRTVPFEVSDEPRAYVIYSDITDRMYQEQRFQEFIEHSTDIISILDSDGTYQYQSPSGERILGHDSSELLGETAFDFIHPDDRDAVMETFSEAVADPELTPTARYRFQHGDGSWRWIESVGNNQLENPAIEGFIVNSRDVTERTERERELERYERIVEAIDDVAFVVNDDWSVDYVNEAVTEYADASVDELKGQPVTKLAEAYVTDSDDPKRFEAMLERAFDAEATQSSPYRLELALDLHVGEVVFEYQFSPLVAEGETSAVVITMRDVTERREREDELERTKERLERRNERLKELTSVISHDLRSPLNVASGRLELARKECESEQLDAVARAHERMGTLMDDLLALARHGDAVSDTDAVDLSELAEACWQNVVTADARLVVDTECVLDADEGRLKRLVENLLRNAIEHGGEDVTVTVGGLEDGNGFYVADDGPGIPEEEREHVLESGYSTSAEGTGFGLGIVNKTADAHGWAVDVTDSEDGGARIDIVDVEPAE